MKHLLITLVLLLFSKFVFGNVQRGSLQNLNSPDIKEMLLANYSKTYKTKAGLEKLKRSTLRYSGKAVPALVQVMKESRFPEKNRWIATFLLGKIVGVKSAPFIAKFSNHPNWVMRLASLKTLLALRQTQYTSIYQKALKDKSLIVRTQALQNIRSLNLKKLAPNVWAMLYDKKNYTQGKNKKKKRTKLISDVIETIGHLRFEKAKAPLLKMVQKKKYDDIFPEINSCLERIFEKESPDGNKNVKRRFWSRVAINNTTI